MHGQASRYLIDERPLTVQPTLIKVFGVEQAIILQQFHWLLGQPRTGIEHDGRRWIWGTYEQWCEDYFPFWLPRTLRYHVNKLQKTGIVITKALRQMDWDRTNYYTIDYTRLDVSIGQHLDASARQQVAASNGQPNDQSNGQPNDASLYRTEKTTEKTTKKTRAKPPPPILVTSNGGGGLHHVNSAQSSGSNGNHNGHHAVTADSDALRSPQSLSARTLAKEWAADFAAGWASLEADLAGWTNAQVRCLLTWLYVWAIEADSQDRNLEPVVRYDASQRLATNYANVYAGSTNRIGLIKSKVMAGVAVSLTEADTAALEGIIEQRNK